MRINETRQPSESLCVCTAKLLGGGADRFQGNPFARGVSLALLDTYPSYFVSPVRSKRGVDESVELTRGKRDVLAGHSPAVLLWRGHSRKRAFRFCVCAYHCLNSHWGRRFWKRCVLQVAYGRCSLLFRERSPAVKH